MLQLLGVDIAIEPRRETIESKGALALIWLSGEDCTRRQPYYVASMHPYILVSCQGKAEGDKQTLKDPIRRKKSNSFLL